eukprot:GILI01007350.1.p1 GENE.GILI01007350.1~~GILI01007350.1.p1  ORF type:complete len:386 (-),score=128.46 GILI01007350.1:280-1350(-)
MTLVKVLSALDRHEEAVSHYQLAVEAVEHHLGTSHPLLLEANEVMGKACADKGLFAEALHLYRKNVELAQRVLGSSHLVTAVYLTKAGHTCRSLNDSDNARSFYSRALLIHETVLGQQAPSTASSCFFLAEAHNMKGDYAAALQFAQRACEVRESLYGPNHVLTLNSWYQVATMAQRAGAYSDSVRYFTLLANELRVTSIEEAQGEALLVSREVQNVVNSVIRMVVSFTFTVPQRVALNKALTCLLQGGSDIPEAIASPAETRSSRRGIKVDPLTDLAHDEVFLRQVLMPLYQSPDPAAVIASLAERVTSEIAGHNNLASLKLLGIIKAVDLFGQEKESLLKVAVSTQQVYSSFRG